VAADGEQQRAGVGGVFALGLGREVAEQQAARLGAAAGLRLGLRGCVQHDRLLRLRVGLEVALRRLGELAGGVGVVAGLRGDLRAGGDGARDADLDGTVDAGADVGDLDDGILRFAAEADDGADRALGLAGHLGLDVGLVLERRAAFRGQVHVEHHLRVVGVTERLVAVRHRVDERGIARRREALAVGGERGFEVARGVGGVAGGGPGLTLGVDVRLDRDLDRRLRGDLGARDVRRDGRDGDGDRE
jgi:hypothetical protein